ncbi:hypothetical protein H0H92_006816 [Tricholoma furcatifolium]|nr:hypothetical protein H0H92_006816 [Tricholoma furcatifolium]
MLATLNQGDRSTTDIQSTFTGVQSDVHSSHHLLKNSASYGQRSLRSNTSSDAALSQVSRRTEIDPQFGGYWDHRILPSLAGSSTSGSHHGNSPRPMRSFRNWESGSDIQAIPLMSSQASSSSGHRSGPSLDATSQLSSGTQRTTGNLTIQTSYTSASESTSPRRRTPGVGPSYTRMSTRGPLPNIPVPSYDAALSAPEVTRDEVKDMASLQFSEHSEYYPNPRRYSALTAITAPPQYER